MNRKLTLTIDERIISFAKDYSSRTNQSISAIVERYFDRLQHQIDLDSLTPEAVELYGILAEQLPDKKVMHQAFHEKDHH